MIKRLIHPIILFIVTMLSYVVVTHYEDFSSFALIFSIGVLALIIFLECFFYYEQRSIPTFRDTKGYLFFFLTSIATIFFVDYVNQAFYEGAPPMANALALPIEIIMILILSEFGFYWYHRLAHEIPFLWKIHGVHHQVDKVNIGSYFFLHPFDAALFKICRTLPIMFIGFSPEAVFIALTMQQTQKFLIHSNSGAPIRLLNYLFISAELHRMHHSKDLSEAGNFGGVLSIWDIIFRSFRTKKEIVPEAYGVQNAAAWPTSIRQLLIYPFSRKQIISNPRSSVANNE